MSIVTLQVLLIVNVNLQNNTFLLYIIKVLRENIERFSLYEINPVIIFQDASAPRSFCVLQLSAPVVLLLVAHGAGAFVPEKERYSFLLILVVNYYNRIIPKHELKTEAM